MGRHVNPRIAVSASGLNTNIRQPMLKLPTLSGFHDLFLKYHIFIFFIYRKLNVSAK
jgi:hypothetical protein